MGHRLPKTVALYGAGLAYGLVLAGLGFAATGAGHGTCVIIGASSSPRGLTQTVAIALLRAPCPSPPTFTP
jgi:hypothetical protein